MDVKNFILSVTLAMILPMEMPGQIAYNDTLSAHNVGVRNDKTDKFEWWQTILPVSLLGVGTLSLVPGFVKNGSRSVTNSLIDMRGNNKRLEFDDYIQYLPVATSLMLGCTGVKARHSLKDRASLLGGGYYGFALNCSF